MQLDMHRDASTPLIPRPGLLVSPAAATAGATRRWLPRLVALALGGCTGAPAEATTGFVDAPVAAVAAPIAGQVAEVPVREGDSVRRGQVLARLDSRERRAIVAKADADVAHARDVLHQAEREAEASEPLVRTAAAEVRRQQAALDEAQVEFDRVSQLAATGAKPQSDLDAARARLEEARADLMGRGASRQASRRQLLTVLAAVETARAALSSAEASLSLARVQLAQTEIESPFDGIVSEQNLEEGEWAAPGTPVITVEDRSHLWVRIDLEETLLEHLSLGRALSIQVVALPGRTFPGHVIEVGAEGEFAVNRDVRRGRPDVRTFRVRVAFDEPDPNLRPGMTAYVALPSGEPSR